MDSLMPSLIDELSGRRAAPKPKVVRAKCYDDLCALHKAQVGDVVFMPSHPSVLMTVKEIHHCNRAAGHYPQEVSVQWLDANGHFTEAKLLARTLLRG